MTIATTLAAQLPDLPDDNDEFVVVISARRADPPGDDPAVRVQDLLNAAQTFLPQLATAVGCELADVLVISGAHNFETDAVNPVQTGAEILAITDDQVDGDTDNG